MPYRDEVTFDEMADAIAYDPDTGIFAWKIRAGKNVFPGTEAGTVKSTRTDASGKKVFYRYIRFKDESYPAQRVAWLLHHGEWPQGKLYFEDGDSLNLRIANLRLGNSLPGSYDQKDPSQRKQYMRDHQAAYPREWKETHLQNKFGISLNEYILMATAQGNKCAICNKEETATRNGKLKVLAVDHEHATGKVRGLLCCSCNQGIGKLGDDPATLRAAADYIEKHAANKAPLLTIVPKEKI